MASRNSNAVKDREDRMLAYYINLITQQEQQEDAKRRSSSGSKSYPDQVEAPKVDSECQSDTFVEAVKPRPVGRPRKHPIPIIDYMKVVIEKEEDVESADKMVVDLDANQVNKTNESTPRQTTPRKYGGTRALEHAEAERIISTILEKRPGRAEFSDPEEKKRKSTEEQQPESSPKKGPAKASANSLAQLEAERIIATIVERRPKQRPSEVVAETKPDVEEESPVPELPMPPVKRGPGRPPKHAKPLTEPSPPANLGFMAKKECSQSPPRPVGRPSKQTSSIKKAPISDEVKKPPPPSSPKPTTQAAPAMEESEFPNLLPVLSQFSFHDVKKLTEWWRQPLGLQVESFEEELAEALSRVASEAKEWDAKCDAAVPAGTLPQVVYI